MEGWIKKGWVHDSWIHGILETSIPGVLDSWKPGWEFTGWEDDYSTSHTLDAWRGRRIYMYPVTLTRNSATVPPFMLLGIHCLRFVVGFL